MPRHSSYPRLPDQIKLVCVTEFSRNPRGGLSVDQIHDRIKKFYAVKDVPSRTTIHRFCSQMVSEGEIQQGKQGYYQRPNDLPFEEMFFNNTGRLTTEVLNLLLLLQDDPDENGKDVREILEDKLVPVTKGIRAVLRIMDATIENPEFVGFAVRINDVLMNEMKEYLTDQDEDWRQEIWDKSHTFGEYVITTRSEENA